MAIESFMSQHEGAVIHTEGVISDELFDKTKVEDDTIEGAFKTLIVSIEDITDEFQDKYLDTPLSLAYKDVILDTDITFTVFMEEIHRLISEVAQNEGIDEGDFTQDFCEYIRIRSGLKETSLEEAREIFGKPKVKLFIRITNGAIMTLRDENLKKVILDSDKPSVVIYGSKHFEKILPFLMEQGFIKK
jgi:hypothetical protein